MKLIILLLVLTIAVNTAFGQEITPCRWGGVMTGKAVHLIKPPVGIWENCNCQFDNEIEQVVVQITIDGNGTVEEAIALSGHPFLRSLSEQAARHSRFSPTIFACERPKTYGEIVYSYNLKENSIYLSNYERILIKEIRDLGIINDSATYLPMPSSPFGNYKVSKDSSIGVQVKVDLQTGAVIEATAIYGHPLFRKPAEDAALRSKFDFRSKWSYAKFGIGVLDYKVEDFIGYASNLILGKSAKNQIVNKKAVYLPKPALNNVMGGKHLRLSKDEIVKVEISVDEQGNVISARAVSGHILLRQTCEYAARNAKFQPILDVGKIKVKVFLVYTIKPNGEVEM